MTRDVEVWSEGITELGSQRTDFKAGGMQLRGHDTACGGGCPNRTDPCVRAGRSQENLENFGTSFFKLIRGS